MKKYLILTLVAALMLGAVSVALADETATTPPSDARSDVQKARDALKEATKAAAQKAKEDKVKAVAEAKKHRTAYNAALKKVWADRDTAYKAAVDARNAAIKKAQDDFKTATAAIKAARLAAEVEAKKLLDTATPLPDEVTATTATN